MSSYVVCQDCRDPLYSYKDRTWPYPCVDCAEGFVAFHRDAFPDHKVAVVVREETTFQQLQEQLRRGA